MYRTVFLASLIALAGCSATELNSKGSTVRIIDNEILAAEIEESCQWLGEVNGSQGNVFTADLTSESNMMAGARNILRNQAAGIGANTVIIQRHQAVESEAFIGSGGHTFIGQAFICKR